MDETGGRSLAADASSVFASKPSASDFHKDSGNSQGVLRTS